MNLAPLPLDHVDLARHAQVLTPRLPEPPVPVYWRHTVEPGGEWHVRWYCERAL